jgi:hypothetical protein
VVSNALSALAVLHHALSDVVSNIISAGGGGVSVTSNELSVVSAQAKSALSDAISVGTATANDLSNDISALDARLTPLSALVSELSNQVSMVVSVPAAETTKSRWTRRVLAAAATVSASAMADISGLSISVTAGGIYRLEAMVLINRVAGTVGGYGLTFPAMTTVRGQLWAPGSVVNAGLPTASIQMVGQPFGEAASGSILLSVISMANVSLHYQVLAVLHPSATGVVQMQLKAAGGASATTVKIGSYIEVERIA